MTPPEGTEPTPTEIVMAGHRGDPGPARRGLGSTSATTRRRALGALARTATLTGPDLDRAAADTDAGVRRTLADLLPRSGAAPDARDRTLGRLLLDPDDRVVEAAAFAAGELLPASPRTVERLIAIAGDHADSLCRESAVAALGSIGAPSARATVVAACSDRANVRRRAVLALVRFDGPDIDRLLDQLVDDRDLQVRQAAEDIIGIRRGTAAGP